MSVIAIALAALDRDQRSRVLRWSAERYGVMLQLGAVGRDIAARGYVGADSCDSEVDGVLDEFSVDDSSFKDFADLFAAANPKSNEHKALVAAYWRQVHEGDEKWQATALQKDLRHLGHAIPNITDALSISIRRRPSRVIQLQKVGSARQARKIYKVTREGLVYVQGMLGHGA